MDKQANKGPSPRVAVDVPAILVLANGQEAGCQLLDVSLEGFRARTSHIASPRDYKQLVSGKETYDVEVRWITGRELGGIFL